MFSVVLVFTPTQSLYPYRTTSDLISVVFLKISPNNNWDWRWVVLSPKIENHGSGFLTSGFSLLLENKKWALNVWF